MVFRHLGTPRVAHFVRMAALSARCGGGWSIGAFDNEPVIITRLHTRSMVECELGYVPAANAEPSNISRRKRRTRHTQGKSYCGRRSPSNVSPKAIRLNK